MISLSASLHSKSKVLTVNICCLQVLAMYKTVVPTGTPRRIHVDSTGILRRYVEDQIPTNFHVISAYFFDVISLVEKSTWLPRTFFDVILLFEKFTWFPRTFLDVISMVEKSTWFPRTFFDVISMVEIRTLFLPTNFDGQRFDIVFGKL